MKVKTKKLLALLVTMAMCMGLVSVPVMATGETMVAQIGNTQYTDVHEAFKALKSSETLTLLQDVAVDNYTFNGINATIDLNDKTLSFISNYTNNGYVRIGFNGSADITFTNGNINLSGATARTAIFHAYNYNGAGELCGLMMSI